MIDFSFLSANGYIETHKYSISDVLLQLKNFCSYSLVEKNILTPNKSPANHTITLSKEFNLDKFPFHTDGANKILPPKYIILENISPITTYTNTIINRFCRILNKKELFTEINKYIFWVSNGRKSFYSSIYSDINESIKLFRWNPVIMKCTYNLNFLIDNYIEDEANIDIQWIPNKIVIINNWECFHARKAVDNISVKYRKINKYCIYTKL